MGPKLDETKQAKKLGTERKKALLGSMPIAVMVGSIVALIMPTMPGPMRTPVSGVVVRTGHPP